MGRPRGWFVTFEGGEGAGKSTQIRLLAEHLQGRGFHVVTTREPGGSTGAEEIRNLLVTGATGRWHPVTEAFLLNAARHEHLAATILPALDAGAWVLCDRFADSTYAYQGYGLGVPFQVLDALNAQAVGPVRPDLTIILDIDPDLGIARTLGRPGAEDRYERMGPEFHQRLRQGYLDIARRDPGRCVVIDASHPIEAIQADIRRLLTARLVEVSP